MRTKFAYLISVLRRDFVNQCSRLLQKDGITPGLLYPVLYIGRHPNCAPKEMMQFLQMDWGLVQRSLDKLVAEGLVRREKNPQDRRCYHLSLTDKGERVFGDSHDMIAAWDAEKLSVLSLEEQEQLEQLLCKVAIALRMDGKSRTTGKK